MVLAREAARERYLPARIRDDSQLIFSFLPGLLAGLFEFPTLDNVPDPDSKLHTTRGPVTALSSVLVEPVGPPKSPSQSDKEPGQSTEAVRISKVKRAGDILHIFSHVRKTYRTQWVLLTGDDAPPALLPKAKSAVTTKKATKGKQKGKAASEDGAVTSEGAKWVTMGEVEHAK